MGSRNQTQEGRCFQQEEEAEKIPGSYHKHGGEADPSPCAQVSKLCEKVSYRGQLGRELLDSGEFVLVIIFELTGDGSLLGRTLPTHTASH